jgi:hypothetical protein
MRLPHAAITSCDLEPNYLGIRANALDHNAERAKQNTCPLEPLKRTSATGYSRLIPSSLPAIDVRSGPKATEALLSSEMTRMGWTGRAPAPNGSQSAWGACQEQEHRHASQVHRSRSHHHHHRN